MTHRDALFDAWLSRMESLGGPDAEFDQLSLRHWAKTIPRGPVLLVTFETLAEVFGRPGGFPVGHLVAEAQGWSHLALISDGTTWFRDPAVYRHFDHLVDDAFFEDFDRVVFFGAEASAHAAAAFSITATDATVLAVRPRAHGRDDAQLARRLDFSTRYGDAAHLAEGAGRTFLLFDPSEPRDAAHAALFAADNVTRLRCRQTGADLPLLLESTGALELLLEMAAEGRLEPRSFAAIWRLRRGSRHWLQTLALAADSPCRREVVRRYIPSA